MFLIDQIREQSILEMEVNHDNFIKDNGISEESIIHTLTFSKDVYKEEKEVREYLKDKYYYNPTIHETDEMFVVSLVAPNQIDSATDISIELRRGVTANAADILPVQISHELMFNNKGEINLSTKLGTIDLNSTGTPHIIEIATVAQGEHPSYGTLNITQEHLESMESNFKSNVTGVDLAVNEDHSKKEAFGWMKDVFLSFDKQTLYGQVQWNMKGTTALSEKEYRYFSPEFRFNYKHPHTGVESGPTLLGGALTNYPFLKMEAITELNNKNNSQGEKPVDKTTIDLNVHNSQIVELNGKVTEIQGKLDASEAQNVELSAKVETLETAQAKVAKEATNQKLFDNDKINAAQLVALNEGKSMLEVLSLSTTMTVVAAGGDSTGDDKTVIELSDGEQKTANALGLTAGEYAAGNK